MKDFIFKRIDDENNVNQQVETFRKSFNITEEFTVTRDWWVKKHYNNPYMNSYIFGVYDGDDLIGINAFSPLLYKYKGFTLSVAESCESGVLPSYRGHHLWSRLVDFAVDYLKNNTDFDFLIGFPNINNSYHGFIKMGWSEPIRMNNMMMVINGQSMGYVLNLSRGLSFCMKMFNFQHFLIRLKSSHKNLEYQFMDIADDKIAMQNVEGFNILCNFDFINWRQDYKSIKVLRVDLGSRTAYCFYTLDSMNDIPFIRLYGIYSNDNSKFYSTLVATSLDILITKYKNAAFIRYWITSDCEKLRVYRHLLFVKSGHQNPFIILPLKDSNEFDGIMEKRNFKDLSFWDLD